MLEQFLVLFFALFAPQNIEMTYPVITADSGGISKPHWVDKSTAMTTTEDVTDYKQGNDPAIR